MPILWQHLLAEWRHRLQSCRESLRDGGDRSAAATMLRIRERILCYLLRRYSTDDPGEAWPQAPLTPPSPQPQVSYFDADYCFRPPLPDVQPSDDFGPRRARELGWTIADISKHVQDAHRKRWWWWFW